MSSLQCLLTTEALLTSHVKASVDYFISYSQDPFQHTKVSTKKCTTVLCGILSCWSLLCGLSSYMYNCQAQVLHLRLSDSIWTICKVLNLCPFIGTFWIQRSFIHIVFQAVHEDPKTSRVVEKTITIVFLSVGIVLGQTQSKSLKVNQSSLLQ